MYSESKSSSTRDWSSNFSKIQFLKAWLQCTPWRTRVPERFGGCPEKWLFRRASLSWWGFCSSRWCSPWSRSHNFKRIFFSQKCRNINLELSNKQFFRDGPDRIFLAEYRRFQQSGGRIRIYDRISAKLVENPAR